MQVYIQWDAGRRVHSIYSKATDERKASFALRQEAVRHAVGEGWVIVRKPAPIPMNGTDYHVFGEQ